MKILHVCLASHYTEGMTYQDNQLSEQNAKDGHDVVVVADCFVYKGSDLVEVPEEDIYLPSGVRLIRFKYDKILNNTVSSKIRKVSRLKTLIESYLPDVILFHGVAGWEMLTVAKYKKNNPKVKLYIDSHEDRHNSGTFWFSLFFQYKLFNNIIVKRISSYVDKFLYLSFESKEFLNKIYGLKDDCLEFYPLGGNVIEPKRREKYESVIRERHKLAINDILIVHSGKLDSPKKTEQLLKAFFRVKSENLRLFIIGSIPNHMEPLLIPLIRRDARVIFLGWKSGDELIQYLSAADLYFQPGTQSATMQNAICCSCPVALYPYPSHEPYIQGNGFFVKNENDYVDVFNTLTRSPHLISQMKKASYKIANDLLDYKKLAARLYE
ncbi:glycosyltransferase family 4 protein [Thiopseudomonas alkaliphila]|uniref:glycosyltransferase family 4 protein n=1 Tax=Thiopseudomonas alkaliphila TaxID=1697053 RepID=UPI003571628C